MSTKYKDEIEIAAIIIASIFSIAAFIFSCRSCSQADDASKISRSALQETRKTSKTTTFLELNDRYLEQHKNLSEVKSKNEKKTIHNDRNKCLLKPCEDNLEKIRRYWYLRFYQWYVTTELDTDFEDSLWNNFYYEDIRQSLKKPCLSFVLCNMLHWQNAENDQLCSLPSNLHGKRDDFLKAIACIIKNNAPEQKCEIDTDSALGELKKYSPCCPYRDDMDISDISDGCFRLDEESDAGPGDSTTWCWMDSGLCDTVELLK